MARKFLIAALTAVAVFGLYYVYEQYQMKQFVKVMEEITVVDPSVLSRLTIAAYPEMEAYTTFEKDQINDAFEALSTIDMKKTKNFKESHTHYKIILASEDNFQMITYTFYEDNYVRREESMLVSSKTGHYKTTDTLFEDKFKPLIEAEGGK